MQSLSQGSDPPNAHLQPPHQQQKTKTLFLRRPKNKSHSMQDLLDVTDSPQDQQQQQQQQPQLQRSQQQRQKHNLDAMTLDHLLLNHPSRGDVMSSSITYGSSGSHALTSGFDFPTTKDASSTLKEQGKHFMENVKTQLQKILDPRTSSNSNDAFQDHESKESRMICTVNLLEFYKSISRQDLYLQYLYKLHDMHLERGDFAEAGFTLLEHASLLRWSQTPLNDQVFPSGGVSERFVDFATHFELKEKLYMDIIHYLDHGRQWERAIALCRELMKEYENMVAEEQQLQQQQQQQQQQWDIEDQRRQSQVAEDEEEEELNLMIDEDSPKEGKSRSSPEDDDVIVLRRKRLVNAASSSTNPAASSHPRDPYEENPVSQRPKTLSISSAASSSSASPYYNHPLPPPHQQQHRPSSNVSSASRMDPCHLHMLSGLLKKQADLCDNIQSAVRPTPQYFRVGFYGRGFSPFLQNKEFVYRGGDYERLSDFVMRMQMEYPAAKLVEKLTSPADVPMELKESSGQWLQVNPVYPWRRVLRSGDSPDVGVADAATAMDLEEEEEEDRFLSEDLLAFHRGNDVKEFAFDRMTKRHDDEEMGSPTNEFASIWVNRTILRTASKLPGILQWSPVSFFQTREVSPLHLAIEKVEEKNRELRRMIDAFHIHEEKVNINQMSMKLNGVVDAAVMGGTANYEEAFCNPLFLETHPGKVKLVDKLQDLLAAQIPILEEGLRIHGENVSLDLLPFHEKLQDCFRTFKSRIVTAYGDRPPYVPPRPPRRRPPPTFPWLGHRDKSSCGSVANGNSLLLQGPSHASSKSNSPCVRNNRINNGTTLYRSPRSYNRSPSNRSSNSSTDSGVAATSNGGGGGGASSSCGVLPECQSSSSLQYLLGSHFNAGDSSFAAPNGFLDDSRLSTSTWADPVSANNHLNNGVAITRTSMTSSASFSTSSQLQQQQQQRQHHQMSASAGPQMMSTSMSFTLPNSSKNSSKSSSSHALAGPLKTAFKSVPNYSSATLGRNLKHTFANWTTLKKQKIGAGSQPDLANSSTSPLSVLETSVISEIATPSSAATSSLNHNNNNYGNNDDDDSKVSSSLAANRSNGISGSKSNIVIELKEDLKPRRPLRPRPRSEAARDRGLSVSRLQTLKRAEKDANAGTSSSTSLGIDGRGGRLLHSKSNPNLSQPAPFDVKDVTDVVAPEISLAKDEQKTVGTELELDADISQKKSKPVQKQKSRKERPVTPSYKSFVADISSASSSSGMEVGKPPRPTSGSSTSENATNSSSNSVLKSVDIVIDSNC